MFTFFFVLSDSVWAGKHPLAHCLFNRSCDNRGNGALPNILWHCAWVIWSDDWSLGHWACCCREQADCQSRTWLGGFQGTIRRWQCIDRESAVMVCFERGNQTVRDDLVCCYSTFFTGTLKKTTKVDFLKHFLYFQRKQIQISNCTSPQLIPPPVYMFHPCLFEQR